MIDLFSGVITFDDGVSIAPNDMAECIAARPGVRETRAAQGRRQFSLGSHPSSGQNWGVGAVFVGSALSQVWLQCLTCVDESILSLENEKARQIFHDKILDAAKLEGIAVNRRGVSLEAVVPWGKISSVLDPRGIQALLIASYDVPQHGSAR